ncbi:MAG: twin-arginine translocase subunit TatC [Pirellulales bacterium]|nr:twin-arginine translocase subunit TatC [Pirellulales bacterium]
MPRLDDDTRFEQSKMSFGEHLEELRRALFKSIASLILGFLVGLYFATDIVAKIQTPVLRSLTTFYLNQAEENSRKNIEVLKSEGREASNADVITAEQLAAQGLMMMEYFISPADLASALREQFPQLQLPERPVDEPPATAQAAGAAAAEASPTLQRKELVRLRLYQPLEEDARLRIVAHETMEPFSIYIRTALMSGVVFSSPFIFYFIWQFIAAGLYRREQQYVYAFLPLSLGLFVGGALLAFFFAFEPLLDFMFWYFDRMGIQPDLRLSDWISFALLMPLAFGVSFQLPLVMLVLERIGIFTVRSYLQKWRAAVVVIAIIAMILTPSQDPYSMMLMGAPLVMLYFGGIWLCKIVPGRSLADPGPGLAGA